MERIIKGKFCRTDSVVGVVYSPTIEEFFQQISDGVREDRLLPHGTAHIYEVNQQQLQEFGIGGHQGDPLRGNNGNVNLHFLRARGLSQNDAGFEDPKLAISKWFPEDSGRRDNWLDFVESRGFDRVNPPAPPGFVVDGCDGKYSNQAIKSVMKSLRSVAERIHKEFIQPTEFEFTVEVDVND